MQAPIYLIADAAEYTAQFAAWLHFHGQHQAALESRDALGKLLGRWLAHVIAYESRAGLEGAPHELTRTTGEQVLCVGVMDWDTHLLGTGQLLAALQAGAYVVPDLGADQLVHSLRSGPERLTRAELVEEVGEQFVERLETRPNITWHVGNVADQVRLRADLAIKRADGRRGALHHSYTASRAGYSESDGLHLGGLARADERYGVIWF